MSRSTWPAGGSRLGLWLRLRLRARFEVRVRARVRARSVRDGLRPHLLVESHLLHALVEHGHDVLQPVARGELLSFERHPARLHRVHVRRARLGREEGEDACAGAHVEHALALEVLLVLVHGELVDRGAHVVLEHALLLHERRIIVEVHLVLVRHPAQLAKRRSAQRQRAEGPILSLSRAAGSGGAHFRRRAIERSHDLVGLSLGRRRHAARLRHVSGASSWLGGKHGPPRPHNQTPIPNVPARA